MDEATTIQDETPYEWAIVEVYGHRKHAGRTREEERFGSKMLRVDIPTVEIVPAEGETRASTKVTRWTTQYYGGAAIFSFTPCDEATVMRINRPYEMAARLEYRAEDYGDDDE